MRDELRERLREQLPDSGISELDNQIADDLIDEFQAFMRKHGLKLMARPEPNTSDARGDYPRIWDDAPLTPWGEGND